MTAEFSNNRLTYEKGLMAITIIYPLRYEGDIDLKGVKIEGTEELGFHSEDFTFLLNERCRQGHFVRVFRFRNDALESKLEIDGAAIKDKRLYMFCGGVAFLTVSIFYRNTENRCIYKLVNPGYMNSSYASFHEVVRDYILGIVVSKKGNVFRPYGSEDSIVNEAYFHNVAVVGKRFKQIETMEQIAYNLHRLKDISHKFEDLSEKDIRYTYGGRDVESETYRWCCCISKQSVSYVYGMEKKEITDSDVADCVFEGLPLTMLAMYQRSACMMMKEKLQSVIEIYSLASKRKINKLNMTAMNFKVNDTIAPSMVSRWNNVCETYRGLYEVNGIPEVLDEIGGKIAFISEEQARRRNTTWGVVAAIITIVGLVQTLVAAIDLVEFLKGVF
ncbi:MAG: hypothetical protein E7296_10250 [Lachnospiraceae bacterium]|nr:hypothetical protein [Lachnospiraceae bacterium]